MQTLQDDLTSQRHQYSNQEIRVYMVKYSYDPLELSPNAYPEQELRVHKGDYLYVRGKMDDDGFFDGELLSGKRGLVPSNFIEIVPDYLLPELLRSALLDLRLSNNNTTCASIQTSHLESSFVHKSSYTKSKIEPMSESKIFNNVQNTQNINDHTFTKPTTKSTTSSAEVSKSSENHYSGNDLCNSDEHLNNIHSPLNLSAHDLNNFSFKDVDTVPPPEHLVLERMLLTSLVISWKPSPLPLKRIQSYEIVVNGTVRASVKPYAKPRALIDTSGIGKDTLKVAVRCLTVRGEVSKDEQCTLVVGKSAAPLDLRAVNIASTCAEITWYPASSAWKHLVLVNGRVDSTLPPAVYRYSVKGLRPSSVYRVAVRSLVPSSSSQTPIRDTITQIEFKTLPGGLPDCPLEVRATPGLSPGSVNVQWLPVTISSSGTSNGAVVTGYDVCRDGEPVAQASGPCADRVSIPLGLLRGCRRLTVRTASLNGHSLDSKVAKVATQLQPLIFVDFKNCLSPHASHYECASPVGDYNSETSECSELSDIAEESEFDDTNNCDVPERFDVDIPSNIPSLEEYQLSVQKQSHHLSGANSAPIYPSKTVHSTFEKHYDSDSELHLHSSPRRHGYHHYVTASDDERAFHEWDRNIYLESKYTSPSRRHVRYFVALFTYDPQRMSPNRRSANEELAFRAGQILKVQGEKDRDGFFKGETRSGRRGFIPSNMVIELIPRGSSRHSGKSLRERAKTVRRMIAMFNYDPRLQSPNVDSEIELKFTAGEIIWVFPVMDDDGFYVGEKSTGERGLVPSNFLERHEEVKHHISGHPSNKYKEWMKKE